MNWDMNWRTAPRHVFLATALSATALSSLPAQAQDSEPREMLNASYDIARELFAAVNPKFIAWWEAEHDETVAVNQSHGGSSTQARSIMQGLRADVVTFNQVTDVNVLADAGLVAEDWQDQYPNNASPYYSTTAFLVRKGNPKEIENWDDLTRDDVSLIFPNPKTSGNGRYTYLAAWAYADQAFNGDEDRIESYMKQFLGNVEVFDTGGRGATTTFVERNIGDVLITFESEVNNIRQEYGEEDYEVVVPPVSILAEFPVAVVDEYAERNGNADLAHGYLDYLYTPEAQRLLADFNYRVNDEEVAADNSDRFPETELLRVEDVFGGWPEAMETHFASGGELDQLQRR